MLLLMILYHTLYDLAVMYQLPIPLYDNLGLVLLQVLIAGTFIFLSGMSSELSRNNLRRGVICFACGAFLTFFTYFFMKEFLIQFGILHLLGVCMILYSFLQPLVRKIPTVAGIVVFGLLFLFTYGVPSGYVGIPGCCIFFCPGNGILLHRICSRWDFPTPLSGRRIIFPCCPGSFVPCGGVFGAAGKRRKTAAVLLSSSPEAAGVFGAAHLDSLFDSSAGDLRRAVFDLWFDPWFSRVIF